MCLGNNDKNNVGNTTVKLTNGKQVPEQDEIAQVSPWPPPPANQLNNKYFVQTNAISSDLNSSLIVTSDMTSMINDSATFMSNKYFTKNNNHNISLSAIEQNNNRLTTQSTTVKNTIINDANNLTKHHHQHHSNAKTTNSTVTRTSSSHFQIAQKQLVLLKNVHTEPPPMLNHILESLSVSNSKHLHHDHRFVEFFKNFLF